MDEIAAAYDAWSSTYDRQSNATRDLDELVLRRIAPDLTGLTVMECGCGTGKNSSWLASRCARLVGLDFSAGMLRIAQSKVNAPNALFLRSDLRASWPVAWSSADLVLFNLVLEHVDRLQPVFREAARALKVGGFLLLSEYHPGRVTAGKGPVVKASDGSVSQRIPNFLHTFDDYRTTAESVGLTMVSWAEWTEEELRTEDPSSAGASEAIPQLVSIIFTRSG